MSDDHFPELLLNFTKEAAQLPHDPDAVATFCREIQIFIGIAEKHGKRTQALLLADLKLKACQQFEQEWAPHGN